MLSVIIPAFNEEAMIEKAYRRISEILKAAEIDCEIIFVDDGSTDATYGKIEYLARTESNLCGIHFSRNFGKEAAISAGLARASGDCAVVIDCDLQHPPEKIVDMYRLWQNGFEIVEGIKTDRGRECRLHGWAARRFYAILSPMVGFDMSNSSDFKLLDRKVIDILNKIPERKGFFRAISYWVGFNKTSVEFEVNERADGASKWSTVSLIRYAVSNICAYSAAPMQIVTLLGAMMLIIAVIFGVWALADKIAGRALEGMTTVIIIMIFIGSIMMISMGVIGYYVARIYEEIKGRPKYIVSARCESVEKTDSSQKIMNGVSR